MFLNLFLLFFFFCLFPLFLFSPGPRYRQQTGLRLIPWVSPLGLGQLQRPPSTSVTYIPSAYPANHTPPLYIHNRVSYQHSSQPHHRPSLVFVEETRLVPLSSAFQHSLSGEGGEGYTGHLSLMPELSFRAATIATAILHQSVGLVSLAWLPCPINREVASGIPHKHTNTINRFLSPDLVGDTQNC